MPRPAPLFLALTLVPALAGCSREPEAFDRREDGACPPGTDVPLKSCDQVPVHRRARRRGRYEIQLPDKWNGTLLIYSHGYRQAEPSPPDFAPVDTEPGAGGHRGGRQRLLAKGYALAGSAFKTNGWDVLDGVAADEALHTFFVDKVGKPDRVYVWGDSLGGLITETLAEKHPEWVSGVGAVVRRARRQQPQPRPGARRRLRREDADLPRPQADRLRQPRRGRRELAGRVRRHHRGRRRRRRTACPRS